MLISSVDASSKLEGRRQIGRCRPILLRPGALCGFGVNHGAEFVLAVDGNEAIRLVEALGNADAVSEVAVIP